MGEAACTSSTSGPLWKLHPVSSQRNKTDVVDGIDSIVKERLRSLSLQRTEFVLLCSLFLAHVREVPLFATEDFNAAVRLA